MLKYVYFASSPIGEDVILLDAYLIEQHRCLRHSIERDIMRMCADIETAPSQEEIAEAKLNFEFNPSVKTCMAYKCKRDAWVSFAEHVCKRIFVYWSCPDHYINIACQKARREDEQRRLAGAYRIR